MYTEVLASHFKNPFLKPAVSFRRNNREDYNKDDYGVSCNDSKDSYGAVQFPANRRRFDAVINALDERDPSPKRVEQRDENVKKIQNALDLLV